jgi:4-amino-4-deoxy-L-arabinose transferase-like glycosyltransferase
VYVKYIRMGFAFTNAGVGLWFGWVSWLLALAGVVILLWQVLAGPRRTSAIVALIFPLMYFLVLSHQSLKFARYLLPMIPSLCLMAGIGLTTAAAQLRRVPALRRWPVLAMLVLLTAVPPATQAARWDYAERKIKTEELAAQWIQQNLPPGKLILIDEPRILLPPQFPSQHATRLLDESLESYRSRGVAYLVSSSQQTDRYFADPGKYAGQVAAWNRIYASTELIKVFRANDDHPGSNITVLRLPAEGR